MDTVNQDDLVRERDFYRAKLADANARIKTLEFDCAELVKRDQDLSKRLSEVANRNANFRPRNRRG